ncbi:MAG: hypothetical protein HY060_24965 [Proteobacteria bacterium]|nr:hypothetical protein [Pseudomonadota bacterium]
MTLRIALAATLLIAFTHFAQAARFIETELRAAVIQMTAGRPEAGQTVEALIGCLRSWNPGDRKSPNNVEIARLNDDTFAVVTVLRSRSVFHFQVAREAGQLVALLQRVEYLIVNRGAYQQLTDAESKRAVLRSTCEKA